MLDSQAERSEEEQEELLKILAKCPFPFSSMLAGDWFIKKVQEFDMKKEGRPTESAPRKESK